MSAEKALTAIQAIVTEAVSNGDNSSYIDRISDVITDQLLVKLDEVKTNVAPVGEWHQCHFCGDLVRDGLGSKGERHWLSDCRPDLVAHEPGDTCTWSHLNVIGERDCYAYLNQDEDKWTDDHKYFYKDGPM